MINKLFAAVFTPRYPRGYIGRHRAPDPEPAPVVLTALAMAPIQTIPTIPTIQTIPTIPSQRAA